MTLSLCLVSTSTVKIYRQDYLLSNKYLTTDVFVNNKPQTIVSYSDVSSQKCIQKTILNIKVLDTIEFFFFSSMWIHKYEFVR